MIFFCASMVSVHIFLAVMTMQINNYNLIDLQLVYSSTFEILQYVMFLHIFILGLRLRIFSIVV